MTKWQTQEGSRVKCSGYDNGAQYAIRTRREGSTAWLDCLVKDAWGKTYWSLDGGLTWHRSRNAAYNSLKFAA